MSEQHRPAEPRTIDCEDEEALQHAARAMGVKPELIREAAAIVGPNRTAVELWLAAPRA